MADTTARVLMLGGMAWSGNAGGRTVNQRFEQTIQASDPYVTAAIINRNALRLAGAI